MCIRRSMILERVEKWWQRSSEWNYEMKYVTETYALSKENERVEMSTRSDNLMKAGSVSILFMTGKWISGISFSFGMLPLCYWLMIFADLLFFNSILFVVSLILSLHLVLESIILRNTQLMFFCVVHLITRTYNRRW